MQDGREFQPSGILEDELEHCGELAARYFSFLLDADPVVDWNDVVPLTVPIDVGKQYPLDLDAVRVLAAICAPLAGVAKSVELADTIAPKLGLRYAWSRFRMHARLLNAIEFAFSDVEFQPNQILEPGCFTGGLLHFLSTVWEGTPVIGFDISSVALDTVKHTSAQLGLPNPPTVIRADFAQVAARNLLPEFQQRIAGSVVILSHLLGTFSQQWACYPGIDPWHANAGVISYWMRAGASVLVCERHDDPQLLIDTIIREAGWAEDEYISVLFDVFDAPSTQGMSADKPLGDWYQSQACVVGFFPRNMQAIFDNLEESSNEPV